MTPEHLKEQPDLGFLTPEQVAERLGMGLTRLKRMRLEGGGPKFVRFGRGVRYRTRELLEWEQAQLREHTTSGW